METVVGTFKDKVIALLDEAYAIRVHDLRKSIEITREALDLSKQHNLPSLAANSLSRLALYAMILGEYQKSLSLSMEAIIIFKELDDERGVADVNYSIAGIYYKSNKYHLGMVYLLDCLMTFRKFNDSHNESRTLKSLGAIYEFLGDYGNAKISYEGAIKSAIRANDENLESNAYNPLSGLLLKLDDVDKAQELIKKSIQLKEKTGDKRGMGFAKYGRGKVFMHLKKYKAAESDLLEAREIHKEAGEQLGECMANSKIALLFLKTDRIQKAKTLLEKTIQFSETHEILIINTKCTHLMYTIYKSENNIEKALKYLEKYTKLKDIIASSQTIKLIENYETAAKIKSSEREARLELEKAEMLADKERAEQSTLVKQEFLSAMSHEIRTPLNAVTSIINLLEVGKTDEEERLLTSLKFSSKNLLRIIDDILDFSKLESNKMKLEKRPVLFKQLLDNISETYGSMAAEKGLQLSISLAPEVAESYGMDETKLFQILGNLLSNAIKYTDTGSVTMVVDLVESTDKNDTLRFKVVDTGIGVSKKELDKLFDSFYMPNSVTTRSFGGTGLGLAIVKSLVELHDSTVSVQSELGIGSEFSFDLCLTRTESPIQSHTELYGQLINKVAILAEDNEINAMVMKLLLEKYGIKIIRATNGEEAITLASEKRVDFILMDIHMPKMNGFEAAKQIRSTINYNCNTPIFALTADLTAADDDTYGKYFNDFLRKPIQIEHLFEALLQVTDLTDVKAAI